MMTVIYAVLVLAALGLAFGVLLAVAGKIFAVETDPRVEQVRSCLAGANCGACGYPGCDGYAAAVVKGEAPVNACVPGGASAAEGIGQIMGVAAAEGERYVAFVRCAGTTGHATEKYTYEGIPSCLAATRLPGGGAKTCAYGCLGLGDCAAACPFDAMHVENGVAVVDRSKCVGCMKCAEACPRGMIVKVPASSTDIVACASKDKGIDVRKLCDFGCIACQLCKRECPADAIVIENNLAVIDQSKCVHCGHCSDICPRKIIHDIR